MGQVDGDGDGEKANQSLNPSLNVPKLSLMRGRVILGLALGIAGICLGVAGVIFSVTAFTFLAAGCAIGGCFSIAGVTLLPLLRRAEEADNLQSRIEAVMTHPLNDGPAQSSPDGDQSVIDPVTGLPDARFFEVAVEGRVAAARRHLWPVSIVLLQLGFDPENNSTEIHNRSVKSFAEMMSLTLREADIACRLNDETFGLILEDTSEEGGVWTAERLQIALSHDTTNIRRLVAGVAAYPTHGLFAKDVLVRARAALTRASSTPAGHGLGQVEVAHVDLS